MTNEAAPTDNRLCAQLLEFQPRGGSAPLWEALKRPAVDVVVATGADAASARPLLSRLLAFAAAHPGVAEHQGLAALLTDDRIDAWAPADMKRSTLVRARTDLRRLARALGTRPARGVVRRDPASLAAAAFWPYVTHLGPFTALGEAYAHGATLREGMWAGLDGLRTQHGDLWVLAPAARGAETGIVPVVQAAARVMREAANQQPEKVSAADANLAPVAAGPVAAAACAKGRPISRTAALKAAREAHARAQQPAAQAPAPVLAPAPTLPDGIAEAVAAYVPNGLVRDWPVIAEATRAALTAYVPPSPRWLSSAGGHVARYAAWVARRSERAAVGELQAAELVAAGLVEEYLDTALAGTPDASKATIRSVLRRVVRGLTGTTLPKLGYTPVQPPYTPVECAGFVRLALNQPKEAGRRAMCAMVGLGLGAGLDGREQKAVTPGHCFDVDLGDGVTGLAVRVEGARARTVVVRAEYEPLVREALRLHTKARRGKSTPLHGQSPTRRNVTSTVTSQAVTATGVGVEINAARLRNTWLVALMSAPAPLSALLHAAGLTGARTLVDLLPYCPAPDPVAVDAALRAATDAQAAATGDDPAGVVA